MCASLVSNPPVKIIFCISLCLVVLKLSLNLLYLTWHEIELFVSKILWKFNLSHSKLNK